MATNATGLDRAVLLDAGSYELTAESSGFASKVEGCN